MSTWTTQTISGPNYQAIWGTSASNIFAVGQNGIVSAVAHFDGTTWAAQTLPASTHVLRAVWGSSATDVWAVGDQNTAFHTTNGGVTWVAVTISTISSNSFRAITGTSASDIYVVGTGGSIWHWTGVKWVQVFTPDNTAVALNGDLKAVQDLIAAGAPPDVRIGSMCEMANGRVRVRLELETGPL